MKIALTIMLIGLLVSPALADQLLLSTITPYPSSGINLLTCDAHVENSEVTPDFYVVDGFEFEVTGEKVVTAVRVRFDFYDTFDEHLGERFATYDERAISPGERIDKTGAYQSINIWNQSIRTVKCSIDTVKYSDDTNWHVETSSETKASTAVPHSADSLWAGAGSALNPIVNGHPKYCTIGDKAPLWTSASCAKARAAWAKRP